MKFSKVFVYFVLGMLLGAGVAVASAYIQHQDQRISNIENYLAAVSAAGR